jgi:hypothetical protein
VSVYNQRFERIVLLQVTFVILHNLRAMTAFHPHRFGLCGFELMTPLCKIMARNHIRNLSKFDVYGVSSIPTVKQRLVPTFCTYQQVYVVGSVHADIKPADKSQLDWVSVASERPLCRAAIFMKNEFPAASVTISRDRLEKTKGHGLKSVIANSGCCPYSYREGFTRRCCGYEQAG